jgi:hypothetical protein
VKLGSAALSGLPTTTWDKFYEFEVFRKGMHYHLRREKDGDDLGIIDLVSTNILKPLQIWPEITQTVILALPILQKLSKKRMKNSIVIDASINLLGPESLLDTVGAAITNSKGHLQHPYCLPIEVKYINPHYFYYRGVRTDLRHLIGPPAGDSEAVRLAQGLGEIFDSLAQLSKSDYTYTGSLEAACAEGLIVTLLKKYDCRHIMLGYAY